MVVLGSYCRSPRRNNVCFVSSALCVRFLTRRFIGEYDHKKGKTHGNISANYTYASCSFLHPCIVKMKTKQKTFVAHRDDLQVQSGGGPGSRGAGDFGFSLQGKRTSFVLLACAVSSTAMGLTSKSIVFSAETFFFALFIFWLYL